MRTHWAISVIASILILGSLGFSQNVLAQTSNPLSAFPITVDGAFDPAEEWSDVTPLAFISPDDPAGDLFSTDLDDPNANAFTYAAVAPGFVTPDPTELYLLYDYLERTDPDFAPGEFVARIVFPVSVGVGNFAQDISLTVIPESLQVFADADEIPIEIIALELRSIGPIAVCPSEPDANNKVSFDVFFEITVDGFIVDEGCASDLGIGAAADFGSSPEGDARGAGEHLIIELEVPLLIPPGFGDPDGPFPPEGLDGIYSPAPAFWGADIANDLFDPPASEAIFTINPDGSTTLDTSFVPPPPPEPTCTLPDVDDAPRDQCADVPVNEICEFACDDGFRPVPPNLTCQDDGEFDANPVCEAIPPPPEPTKVEVCHKGKKTITISENAVPAHLKHGDSIGPCD